MLYSYDVFDTLIWRTVPRAKDIFRLMETNEHFGRIWEGRWGSFAQLRVWAEKHVRSNRFSETAIEKIYAELQRRVSCSDECVRELMLLELLTEKKYTILNPEIVGEIRRHIDSGERVVLITDMYWHERQIRELLMEKDAVFSAIPIYVSSDCGTSKSKLMLYCRIRKAESAEYGQWVHTGDNGLSDIRLPSFLGIAVRRVRSGVRFDFEKSEEHRKTDALKVYGTVAEVRANSHGAAYDLGASFAAPVLYHYVEWVLEQAIKKGIEKLYFVMRDGYILKTIADLIINERNLPVDTAYIFGSRVAWRLPDLTLDKLHSMSVWDRSNWIFRDACYLYVPFERLGFSREELAPFLGGISPLLELRSFSDFRRILKKLLDDERFCSLLEEKIRHSQHMLVSYWEQTVDEKQSYALVDVNGTGKTQTALNRTLRSVEPDRKPVRFFYHTFMSAEANEEIQFTYCKAKEPDRILPEVLVRAPYNPCYGYRMGLGGKAEPFFFDGEFCAWNGAFDYDNYLEGITAFVRRCLSDRIYKEAAGAYAEALLKAACMERVSRDLIIQLAGIPFNPDMSGEERRAFYPDLQLSAIFHPFTQLVYYPKGSFYRKGKFWKLMYSILFTGVRMARRLRNEKTADNAES